MKRFPQKLDSIRNPRRFLLTCVMLVICQFCNTRHTSVIAQENGTAAQSGLRPAREHFVPTDQLDAVFDRDRRGVLMSREEFRALLKKADDNKSTRGQHPAAILAEKASIAVVPGDQHVVISMNVTIRQFADGWQVVRLPVGNLLVEKAELDGMPSATISRDPNAPDVLLFAHEGSGVIQLRLSLSTPLAIVGSDRSAAFQLPQVPVTELRVSCPAGQRVLVNDLKLDRPAADDQPAEYSVPVGTAEQVRLVWSVQRDQSEVQTLVFVRTDAQLQLQKETLRWLSDSRVSVFGGSINRVICRVPSRMEITGVESTGLESWTLEDDMDHPGMTRVTLSYRQPFSNDRMIRILGVAAVPDSSSMTVPSITFADVTSHVGRLAVAHADGLRLIAEAGAGIRPVSVSVGENISFQLSVFDFWLQQYELTVAVKPRDQELFAELNSALSIADTSVTLISTLTVETLNAPLFQLPISIPADWQLTEVSAGGVPLEWRAVDEQKQITVTPPAPIPAGGLFELRLQMTRTIPDPESEQRLLLPVINPEETTLVGGSYVVQFANDLNVSPLSLIGLRPTTGSGTELVFENVGTTISGELAISRKPARLASRSILRTWTDARQETLDAEITIDVLHGTTRSVTVRLPEALGTDVRFDVISFGIVPGFESQQIARPVQIIEQSPLDPIDGMRPFLLKLDKRFAGSMTVRAIVNRARTAEQQELSAPSVLVQDAVRQHGILVFEAYPEQRLTPTKDVSEIDGLFAVDAGLVDAPSSTTSRRVALTYRFVQPTYQLAVRETRFDTDAVPSAVCVAVRNVCTLSEAGGIQRSCRATFRASGVQTLRFTLPNAEGAFLWSTILNGEPVEVRRTAEDYLVALPPQAENQEQVIEILFESGGRNGEAFGTLEQAPVRFAMDVSDSTSVPIDVLEQTWDIRYPSTALLVDSDGDFEAINGVDQPGWFRNAFALSELTWGTVVPRLVYPAVLVVVLFLVTAMSARRQWKRMAGSAVLILLAGAVLLVTTLTTSKSARFQEVGNFLGDSAEYATPESAPTTAADVRLVYPAAPGPAGPGGGGFGGGGGMGSGGMGGFGGYAGGVPGSGAPAEMPISEPAMMEGAPGMTPPAPAAEAQSDALPLPSAEPAGAEDQSGMAFQQAVPPGEGRQVTDELILTPGQAQAPFAGQLAGQESGSGEQGMTGAATKKSGSARLSVQVALEIPEDYRSREFHSIGDQIRRPGTLELVVQRHDQILVIRIIVALLVLLICWWMRNRSVVSRAAFIIVLALSAAAAIPLLENQWQSTVDGIILGVVLGLGIWCADFGVKIVNRCMAAVRSVFHLNPAQSTPAVCLMIIVSSFGVSEAVAQEPVPPVTEPRIVAPYAPDEPALRANRIFVPHDEFMKLYQQANPGALQTTPASPLGTSVLAAFYKADQLRQVKETQYILSVSGRYVLWNDSNGPASITLPIGQAGFRSARLNGEEATLQATENLTDVQILVPTKGMHIVDIEFDVSAEVDSGVGRVDLALRPVASGTLELTLPAPAEGQPQLEVRVDGRSNVYRRDGNVIILPIAQSGQTRIQWQPSAKRNVTDVVYHSDVRSALAVEDSGMTFRATISTSVRQGELNELDVTIPEGYSVQSVTGPDVAGWSTQNTDSSRAIRFLFRRAVNDGTVVTIQLYADAQNDDLKSALAVPILVVRGATRDLGTVTLMAGSQFQVRSDGLSGVSQINPQDAPMPEGNELPGRRMLAWRYTRHPAEVSVKLSRIAEELKVVALHAARLEEQRVLWTSQWTATITGAPRSRVDIVVPEAFLTLKVNATGIKDWYVEDISAAENEPARKVLSIQFDRAREGTIVISVQGQTDRGADRSQLVLDTPVLLDANEAQSQLAMWLDAASEIANVDAGGWQNRPPASIASAYRQIAEASASLALTSSAVRPQPANITLRQAVPTFIAESVTVTNVTDTALEMTLALNWQVTRAASDTFAVELPAVLADGLVFDVPSQRRIQKDDLGNGRKRVIFQLQQPVSGGMFVLGSGSLPLPADESLRADAPLFVTSETSPATLSGQSHFWVLVNQSAGLLQPTGDTKKDEVAADQLKTRITEELLSQSVTIQRLTSETPAWTLKFPEQHQVSPAIITVASHTTVIADDGSWRSHHELNVRNESRQFLPVTIPADSRILYCRVRGNASRIVNRGDEAKRQHLIPIPQSGQIASTFVVEFGLAGALGDDAVDFRKKLNSHRLQIPVPEFPEFRDDPEFGITVSRNRWSVFVPRSWQTKIVDEPRLTNVIPSNEQGLLEIFQQAQIEEARSLLMSAKNTKGMALFGRLQSEIGQQMNTLSSQTYSAEQATERAELMQSLIDANEAVILENSAQLAGQQASGVPQRGQSLLNFGSVGNGSSNDFLLQQELDINKLNYRNGDQLIQFNRPGNSKGTQDSEAGAADRFLFDVPQLEGADKEIRELKEIEDLKRLEDFGVRKGAAEKSEASQRDGKPAADFESKQAVPRNSGSQLLERGRRMNLGKSMDAAPEQDRAAEMSQMADPFSAAPNSGLQAPPIQAGNAMQNDAMQSGEGMQFGQGMQAPQTRGIQLFNDVMQGGETTAARSTGLLSLQFMIPQDGTRLDFTRTDGNPVLTVDVRGTEAVSSVYGILWAAVCAVSGFIILRASGAKSTTAFFRTVFGILATASLSGSLLLAPPASSLCIVLFTASAIMFCVFVVAESLRKQAA